MGPEVREGPENRVKWPKGARRKGKHISHGEFNLHLGTWKYFPRWFCKHLKVSSFLTWEGLEAAVTFPAAPGLLVLTTGTCGGGRHGLRGMRDVPSSSPEPVHPSDCQPTHRPGAIHVHTSHLLSLLCVCRWPGPGVQSPPPKGPQASS